MAKLYFRHGTVGSAKTLNLLAVAHNYERQGKSCVVVKPAFDTRFSDREVVSRAGLKRTATLVVEADTRLDFERLAGNNCVLVDEAQFLSASVVEQFRAIISPPQAAILAIGRTQPTPVVVDGQIVIKKARRSDETYFGPHTALAPDLIIGYSRGYRGAWTTCLGDMDETVFSDNDSAWGADHCTDSSEVPGVLFSNHPITKEDPALIDLAPTILAEFGLEKPAQMTGEVIYEIVDFRLPILGSVTPL